MHIPFDEMSDNARLWIYQADRPFTAQEETIIKQETEAFLKAWAAHGAGLNSSYAIFYQRFLIIAVDEAMVKASGCSIDKQVHFIQTLGNRLSINFLDRTKIAFLTNNPEEKATNLVFLTPLGELKNSVASGNVKPDTLVFNNLVETKSQLQQKWLVPAGDSWLKRYFQ